MKQEDFFKRYSYSIRTDKIGGGAFGTVYKAHDNVLHRDVAIKVSEVKIIGDKEFSLRDEFEAIKNLPPHPNIANYEALFTFESPQGIFDYALMQYYPDGNLAKAISNGLSEQQKEQIAIQLLEGIDHLHKNKIVHRDLKPANILIVQRAGQFIPLITDFGLSKHKEEGEHSRFSNSFGGGTLKYSSPEQLKAEPIRFNTDLWAYGVIVYEIFTGESLFKCEKANASSAEAEEEIFLQIKNRDVVKELQKIPQGWQKAIASCLEREPTKRIKSSTELLLCIQSSGRQEKAPILDTETLKTEPIAETEETQIYREPQEKPRSQAQQPKPSVPQPAEPKPPEHPPQNPRKPKSKNKLIWYIIPFILLAIIAAGVFFLGKEKKEISINTNPEGVLLSIDGEPYGRTPWTGTLAFGKHSIKLVNGKKTVNDQITISQNGKSSFSYEVSEIETITETVNGVIFTMVAVKGGCFQMGSNDGYDGEKPVHEVCLDDYYIGQTEVTQALWKAVMNNTPSRFKGDKLPVEQVSWNDAQEFIKKLNRMTGKNFRLPTEAEWEYAARGGALSTLATATYAGSNNIDEVAWYFGNSGGGPNPVAQKKANALGIYDMSGNVWEWCSDWYDEGYYKNSPRNNPRGPSSGYGRVFRGGCWDSFWGGCRSAYRSHDTPDYRGSYLGFRLVSPK